MSKCLNIISLIFFLAATSLLADDNEYYDLQTLLTGSNKVTTLPNKVEKVEENNKPVPTSNNYSWSGGSLVFTDQQIEEIDRALENSLSTNKQSNHNSSNVNLLDEKTYQSILGEIHYQDNDQTYPRYFAFNAELYFDPHNWVVWINDEKFTPQHKTSSKLNISLVDVADEMAIIKWEPKKAISQIISNWGSLFAELKEASKNIFTDKSEKIIYDKEKNTLIFTLSPNQTMDINKLTIEEGIINVSKSSSSNRKSK